MLPDYENSRWQHDLISSSQQAKPPTISEREKGTNEREKGTGVLNRSLIAGELGVDVLAVASAREIIAQAGVPATGASGMTEAFDWLRPVATPGLSGGYARPIEENQTDTNSDFPLATKDPQAAGRHAGLYDSGFTPPGRRMRSAGDGTEGIQERSAISHQRSVRDKFPIRKHPDAIFGGRAQHAKVVWAERKRMQGSGGAEACDDQAGSDAPPCRPQGGGEHWRRSTQSSITTDRPVATAAKAFGNPRSKAHRTAMTEWLGANRYQDCTKSNQPPKSLNHRPQIQRTHHHRQTAPSFYSLAAERREWVRRSHV